MITVQPVEHVTPTTNTCSKQEIS